MTVAPTRKAPAGFTLIEIIVSAGLMGLMMAMAVRGFSEARKLGDIAKARSIARQEAGIGVQKLARILSRCHVIYFDTRPLNGITSTPVATSLSSIRAAVPPQLVSGSINGTALANPAIPFGGTTSTLYIQPFRDFRTTTAARAAFRVRPLNDSLPGFETAGNNPQLMLAPGEYTSGARTSNFDHTFPSPLLYCAEANLAVGVPDANNTMLAAALPVTWTFYLVYLAPMRFETNDDGNGLFPVQEAATNRTANGFRDMGRRSDSTTGTANTRWTRATLPYELRLLTIPDVQALRTPLVTDTGQLAAVPPVPGKAMGRHFDSVGVLEAPFDIPRGEVNYDPVPLATVDHGLDATRHPVYTSTQASGSRVSGQGSHGNWNNIGNDPPANVCFNLRNLYDASANGGQGQMVAAREITDVVLASHIDPDSVHGTCVRLGNDWVRKSGGIGLIAKGETNPRPYVNAMGGPQKYQPSWWNADNPDTLAGPPKRALVSVSTRFRYTRQTPFAFATESVEVELEALQRFQTTSRLRRN
ncbi:MAG: prepilin-type N-terminal cleavage/methylation domain-containing protein [Candidatus Sericytochromatia bacterium]|nr:prepilin-type N-terminal cleavage/methylation domain-containing protein [Candidatus Sericytochromatia bacterium]